MSIFHATNPIHPYITWSDIQRSLEIFTDAVMPSNGIDSWRHPCPRDMGVEPTKGCFSDSTQRLVSNSLICGVSAARSEGYILRAIVELHLGGYRCVAAAKIISDLDSAWRVARCVDRALVSILFDCAMPAPVAMSMALPRHYRSDRESNLSGNVFVRWSDNILHVSDEDGHVLENLSCANSQRHLIDARRRDWIAVLANLAPEAHVVEAPSTQSLNS